MGKTYWLILALAVLGCFNAGTVWLTQFSCYPLWPYVGSGDFGAYYQFWQQSTFGTVVVPYALAALGSLVLLGIAPPELPRWALWAGCALQAGIELMSWFWFQPLERQIALASAGLNAPAYQQLVAANWLRIGSVTAFAALALWMLSRAFWSKASSPRGQRILCVTSGLSLFGVGNIWLVQLVCYSIWPYVGRATAYAYHVAWWRSIWGVVFVPAGVVLVGSFALLWIRPEGVSRRAAWAGLTLQLVAYLLTAVWWGPLMARLATPEAGLSLHLYHLMMMTHWFRVALFTAYGILCCSMLIQSATGSRYGKTLEVPTT